MLAPTFRVKHSNPFTQQTLYHTAIIALQPNANVGFKDAVLLIPE